MKIRLNITLLALISICIHAQYKKLEINRDLLIPADTTHRIVHDSIIYSKDYFNVQDSSSRNSSVSFNYGQDIESKYDNNREVKENNQIEKYNNIDFSNLLMPKQNFLGFIGSDYKRLRIIFKVITKEKNATNKYLVKGLSIVDKNKCDFEGYIILIQAKEYKNTKVWIDTLNKDSTFEARGYLIGKYTFYENKNQKNTGMFKGILKSYWYLDKYDKIHYDDLEGFADNYRNNQFQGVWKSYLNDKEIVCNWGELRIPNCGDLDIGVGEFSPNPKYLNNGWEDLSIK
jgi:hypothetical protein